MIIIIVSVVLSIISSIIAAVIKSRQKSYTTVSMNSVGNVAGTKFKGGCKPGAFITEISGKKGSKIDQLNFKCSDDDELSYGPYGGKGGNAFGTANKEGLSTMNVYSSAEQINAIETNQKFGGDGELSIFTCANGGKINGFHGTSDGKFVSSLGVTCMTEDGVTVDEEV